MEKIVKYFDGGEVKSIDEQNHIVRAVVSSDSVDRYGDIVLPDAFKSTVDAYLKHPVLLSSHSYYSLTDQIGRAKAVHINANNVEVDFEYFVGKGNPEADWGWELAKKGVAGWSIGFMANKYENIMDADNKFATGRKFTDIELLEISQVLIPANRDAIQNDFNAADMRRRLYEKAVPLIEKGEIKPIEEKKDSPEPEPHYSEELMGAGDKDPIPTPDIDAEGVAEAIREGLKL